MIFDNEAGLRAYFFAILFGAILFSVFMIKALAADPPCPIGQIRVEVEGPSVCTTQPCSSPLICKGRQCKLRDCTSCKPSTEVRCLTKAEHNRALRK